jgi:hypothetical protein
MANLWQPFMVVEAFEILGHDLVSENHVDARKV